MRHVLALSALVVLVAAGAARADHPHGTRSKPSPAVTLTMTSAPAAADAGRRVVVLDAVARRDVGALELSVGARTIRFGATRAGQHRRLELELPASAVADAIGAARIGRGARVWTRIATTPVPAERPARAFTIYTVKGRSVAEVRE